MDEGHRRKLRLKEKMKSALKKFRRGERVLNARLLSKKRIADLALFDQPKKPWWVFW